MAQANENIEYSFVRKLLCDDLTIVSPEIVIAKPQKSTLHSDITHFLKCG